jgi:CRP/FNR family transcriptional regulator, cyclic AMP receptor protein
MPNRRTSNLSVEDRTQILRRSEIGAELSEALIVRLATSSTVTDYRRRRFIYRTGDKADGLYVIARGRVKISRIEEATSREAVINILAAGSLFGESSLYGEGTREKCAVAYENTRLLCMPVEEFQKGMTEHRDLYDYTFRLIGQRLVETERRVADFALDAIPARLEKLLIDFSRRYGVRENNGVLIDLCLPHREIASLVGSTRESVTVRLNAMKREGIIDIVNRKILIKRPESLAVMI